MRTAFRWLVRLPGLGVLRRLGERFVRLRVAPQFDEVHHRLAALEGRLAAATHALEEQERLRREQAAVTAELRSHVDGLRFDVERMAPVVASLEVRVADLRHDADSLLTSSPASADPSWDLLGQVRREHARIRARLSAVASYEERLRRLEAG